MDQKQWQKLLHENSLVVESKFKVWTSNMDSKYAKSKRVEKNNEREFDNEQDAKKYVKELMKKYNLKKHAGHIVNYSDDIELWTNF